jgi:hypothetical protein
MPKKEKLPHRIDETVAEIAAILARGFMKYKRRRAVCGKRHRRPGHGRRVRPGRQPGWRGPAARLPLRGKEYP